MTECTTSVNAGNNSADLQHICNLLSLVSNWYVSWSSIIWIVSSPASLLFESIWSVFEGITCVNVYWITCFCSPRNSEICFRFVRPSVTFFLHKSSLNFYYRNETHTQWKPLSSSMPWRNLFFYAITIFAGNDKHFNYGSLKRPKVCPLVMLNVMR